MNTLQKLIQALKQLVELLKRKLALVQKKKIIIIHHTATSRDYTTFDSINRGHKTRMVRIDGKLRQGFPKSSLGYYVAYHYLITGDGTVHQARKENEKSYASTSYKHPKLEIGHTGNYMNEKPSQRQSAALESILKRYPDLKVVGHREVSRTLCPGDNMMKYLKGRS